MAHVNFALPDPQASTDLSHTKWNSADLTGATFTGAVLDGADFTSAILTAANLTYIQGKGTIFTGAQLKADQINGKQGATADFAHLEDVKFDSADLSYASFSYATLTGPKVLLSKATLTGSYWENANLSGIDTDRVDCAGGGPQRRQSRQYELEEHRSGVQRVQGYGHQHPGTGEAGTRLFLWLDAGCHGTDLRQSHQCLYLKCAHSR